MDVVEPISTYGLVIPADSPNTGPEGDYELDGFAVERSKPHQPMLRERLLMLTRREYLRQLWTEQHHRCDSWELH